MQVDLQKAISQEYVNAQQWASREWEDAARSTAGPIITPGDFNSESLMTKGRLSVLNEKARRIIVGVESAFQGRRHGPETADVDELCRTLDSTLESDVAHIVSRIGAGYQRDPAHLLPLRTRARERGTEERHRLMHEFNEMLVRLQHEHSAATPESKITHVTVHSNYGQIGDHNQQQLHIQMQTFRDLIASIDKSDAPVEAKEEAKGFLRRFFENPTVTAAAGGLAQGVIGLLNPGSS